MTPDRELLQEGDRSLLPSCIECGSDKVVRPGFVSYHYRRGKWIVQRYSEELADTVCVSCQNCGLSMEGNHEPPFNYVRTSHD